jgi:hypothetical protein
MPRAREADPVDRLYQLPLAEFTAARNTLAKTAGAAGADIRSLAKPPVAAWAVNQVYWRRRAVYDELIAASQEVRQAHAAVLGGKAADPRSAGRRHEDAIDAALRAATDILRDDGQPVTDATRQAMATTLRALPAGDTAPGRLDRTLQPGGFEMLAGLALVAPRPGARPAPGRPAAAPPPPARKGSPDRRLESARAAAAGALRDLRAAEHAKEREEFKAARAARDAEKAERAIEEAEATLEEAKRALARAQRDRDAALGARDEAETRIEHAEERLRAARGRAADADALVRKLSRAT